MPHVRTGCIPPLRRVTFHKVNTLTQAGGRQGQVLKNTDRGGSLKSRFSGGFFPVAAFAGVSAVRGRGCLLVERDCLTRHFAEERPHPGAALSENGRAWNLFCLGRSSIAGDMRTMCAARRGVWLQGGRCPAETLRKLAGPCRIRTPDKNCLDPLADKDTLST